MRTYLILFQYGVSSCFQYKCESHSGERIAGLPPAMAFMNTGYSLLRQKNLITHEIQPATVFPGSGCRLSFVRSQKKDFLE